MSKVVAMLKCSLTDVSMWVITSPLFKEPTWTQTSLNTRTVEGRDTQHSYIASKRLNILNAMVLTNLSTIDNSDNVAKLTRKLIHPD